jgi:hypothetical protein
VTKGAVSAVWADLAYTDVQTTSLPRSVLSSFVSVFRTEMDLFCPERGMWRLFALLPPKSAKSDLLIAVLDSTYDTHRETSHSYEFRTAIRCHGGKFILGPPDIVAHEVSGSTVKVSRTINVSRTVNVSRTEMCPGRTKCPVSMIGVRLHVSKVRLQRPFRTRTRTERTAQAYGASVRRKRTGKYHPDPDPYLYSVH